MKEVLSTDSQTGKVMVKRYALTQSGVTINTFQKVNTIASDAVDVETEEINAKKDYALDCMEVISEQNNWLDITFPIYIKAAIYHPTIQVINKFSEKAKILFMANSNIVKAFDIGSLDVGITNLDFLSGDQIATETNPENPEEVTNRYFKSSGFMATNISDWESPIILNPRSTDTPVDVAVKVLGNTDPAACGIFKMSIIPIE